MPNTLNPKYLFMQDAKKLIGNGKSYYQMFAIYNIPFVYQLHKGRKQTQSIPCQRRKEAGRTSQGWKSWEDVMPEGPESPINLHIQMGPAIYKRLKSEALTYLLAHSGDSLDIVNAWAWVFRQVDAQVQAGEKDVHAKLGMRA
jgi:hypothetical protein